MVTIAVIYGILAVCLGLSLWKNKTQQAFRVTARSLWKMAPGLLAIVGGGRLDPGHLSARNHFQAA